MGVSERCKLLAGDCLQTVSEDGIGAFDWFALGMHCEWVAGARLAGSNKGIL